MKEHQKEARIDPEITLDQTSEKSGLKNKDVKDDGVKDIKDRVKDIKDIKDKEYISGKEPLSDSLPPDPLAEMTDLLKRTQANFENYRKQQEKRIEEIREMAAKDLVIQLLPVLDNFELALKNVDLAAHPKDFINGLQLIRSQLNTVLENVGVKVIGTENQPFDPYYHEALMKQPSDQPEGIIIEEFQKGFTLHHQVIRHAKVKVSSGKGPQTNKPTGK